MRQITFASQPSFEKYARSIRREQFLNSMEAVVPWSELKALIAPHDPKAGKGRQPVGLGIMRRIYFLQHWFNLSDSGAEDALYKSPMLPNLLHGGGNKVWGDSGYQKQTKAIQEAAPQAQDRTNRRVKTKQGVEEEKKRKNRTKSRVRAKVEWPFRILKRDFGYTKVRYRGIKKNHEWLLTAFALVNLYQHRKRLALLAA